MTTNLTPPPAPTTPPAGPATPPQQPRGSSKVIAILAISIGAVLLAGAVFTGVFSAVRAAATESRTLTADAAGITDLDIDIAAADLTVVYAGAEAHLDVTGNADDWRLTRNGNSLSVTTDRGWWGGWRLFGEGDVAVLTLPTALQNTPIDATFGLSAGVISASGTFGQLALDLSAGRIDVTGPAESIDADVSAGRIDLDTADVSTADLRISAGQLNGTFTGTAPDSVRIDVSAGSLALTLPDVDYAVSSNTSAGELSNDLSVASASPHRVDVNLSAGSVVLRAE